MKNIIRFTEENTECGCCGKTGLKGTWEVEIDGAVFYFGSTCVNKQGFSSKDKSVAVNKAKIKARSEQIKKFSDYLDSLDNSMFE